jgi:DNA-binding MarR family transcriptional regulator
MSRHKQQRSLQEREYLELAEFRYQLRKFLRHMEQHCRQAGLQPQQYQLILAIKGLPKGRTPSISVLAERMQLNHNSIVELIDRCEEKGLIRRSRSLLDRRQVTLALAPTGETVLRMLAAAGRQELRTIASTLVRSVHQLTASISQGVNVSAFGPSSVINSEAARATS